jgi:hypothetical protein
MDMMKQMGVKHPSGNLKQLQEKAKALSLPIIHLKDVIQEGWIGKPKGYCKSYTKGVGLTLQTLRSTQRRVV